MAIDVQGIIAENAGEISDDHLQIGQEILLEHPRPGNQTSNTQYFGYYGSAGHAFGPDYMDEIGSMHNSNVAFASPDLIEKSLNNGMAPIVSFADLLQWKTDENGQTHMVDNWEQLYENFQTSIEPYVDRIFAFYQDEPKWNGIPENVFRYCTQRLRQDYPHIRVMSCMAVPTLQDCSPSYFEFCTDLSYNYYGEWNINQRLEYLQQLKQIAIYKYTLLLLFLYCCFFFLG